MKFNFNLFNLITGILMTSFGIILLSNIGSSHVIAFEVLGFTMTVISTFISFQFSKYHSVKYSWINKNIKVDALKFAGKFDVILAIETGGLHVASALNSYLNLPIKTVILKSYGSSELSDSIKQIENGFNVEDFLGKRVLIVDDLIDSGKTLEFLLGKFLDNYKLENRNLSVYVLFDSGNLNTDIKIFSVEPKPNKWIVFPWE